MTDTSVHLNGINKYSEGLKERGGNGEPNDGARMS